MKTSWFEMRAPGEDRRWLGNRAYDDRPSGDLMAIAVSDATPDISGA
jgi:hypothetical protein